MIGSKQLKRFNKDQVGIKMNLHQKYHKLYLDSGSKSQDEKRSCSRPLSLSLSLSLSWSWSCSWSGGWSLDWDWSDSRPRSLSQDQ